MTADWHEADLWVRALFPTAVENGTATFHVPYAAKRRPADGHEVPAITWFDLSNENAGLSLLNNAKYGCSVDGSKLTISLLRNPVSPKCPDPNPDEGWHQFTYSLYPHTGDWKAARSMREGAGLNQTLLGYVKHKQDRSGKLPLTFSFVEIEPENLMVTALKRAESSNDLILRFVELHGKDAQAKVTLPREIKSAKTVNLLENKIDGDVSVEGKQVRLTVKPYQIKSLRIRF
jgi:alpha-mannosidase